MSGKGNMIAEKGGEEFDLYRGMLVSGAFWGAEKNCFPGHNMRRAKGR